MFPTTDPSLLGPSPESQQDNARKQAQEELRDFARKTIGVQELSPHLDRFVSSLVDGPKQRIIEGTDVLPKGGTFETDRDALYCGCGQLKDQHDDPYVFCSATRKERTKEGFDPFSTVGYLNRIDRLKAQQEEDGEE